MIIKIESIQHVVKDFYDNALSDFLIGYHFQKIKDFDSHIERITDFWNLQLNGDMLDRSHLPFKLIEAHKALGLKPGEIGRWVVLFKKSLDKSDMDTKQKKIWLEKVESFSQKIMATLP